MTRGVWDRLADWFLWSVYAVGLVVVVILSVFKRERVSMTCGQCKVVFLGPRSCPNCGAKGYEYD